MSLPRNKEVDRQVGGGCLPPPVRGSIKLLGQYQDLDTGHSYPIKSTGTGKFHLALTEGNAGVSSWYIV